MSTDHSKLIYICQLTASLLGGLLLPSKLTVSSKSIRTVAVCLAQGPITDWINKQLSLLCDGGAYRSEIGCHGLARLIPVRGLKSRVAKNLYSIAWSQSFQTSETNFASLICKWPHERLMLKQPGIKTQRLALNGSSRNAYLILGARVAREWAVMQPKLRYLKLSTAKRS